MSNATSSLDLTRIKADMARYEELSKMNIYKFVATVSRTEVDDLRRRLMKAVWPLMAEVERLQIAKEQRNER